MKGRKDKDSIAELSNELKEYERMMKDVSDYTSSMEFLEGGEVERIKAEKLRSEVGSKREEISEFIHFMRSELDIYSGIFSLLKDIQMDCSGYEWGYYIKRMKETGGKEIDF